MKKKSYVRKSEREKGVEAVFECQRCGFRQSRKNKFNNY